MIEKIYYSEKLKLNYKIKQDFLGDRIIVFEDGVNYNNSEMQKIKGFSDNNIRNIHNLKLIFEGELL